MQSGSTGENRPQEPLVVCSVREADAAAFRRSLARVPDGCGLVELRADDLSVEEIPAIVRASRQPAIVTLRRISEGGGFDRSEEERERGFRAALDAGARFIDVERGCPQEVLIDGPDAFRIILSDHGAECSLRALRPILEKMASRGAARLKIVPNAAKLADAVVIRDLLKLAAASGVTLAAFAQGRAGSLTRVLASSWGSWASYGALYSGGETAPGQFTADDLLETYDVLGIGATTRLFFLLGSAVAASPSPAMHRAGHREAQLDARYVPLELDSFEDCLPLLEPGAAFPIDGLAVTLPFKEAAAARCRLEDVIARSARAVNTVLVDNDGWRGFNTDGPAVVSLVRRRMETSGASAAVVGAGGTALAAAAALKRAGCRVTVFNRTRSRADALARRLGVAAADLDALQGHAWDLLVQATPLGAQGERLLPRDALRGRMVLDAVYGRETPLLADARANGLAVADGFDLLVAQAVPQFEWMTGLAPDPATLREAGLRWLAQRAAYLP